MREQVVQRDQAVDGLRGLAVVLMVAAHTTDHVSAGNAFWSMIRDLGDAVAYSTFLFVFGIGVYLSLLGRSARQPVIRAALKRTLAMFGAYLLISGWTIWLYLGFSSPMIYVAMLLFIAVPQYVEFMVSFIVFMLILIGLKMLTRQPGFFGLERRIEPVLLSGLLLFLGGMALFYNAGVGPIPGFGPAYQGSFGPVVEAAYMGLLVGHPDFLRFALLQYAPILLIGIWTGAVLAGHTRRPENIRSRLVNLGLLLLGGLLLLRAPSYLGTAALLDVEMRWPPSLAFVLRSTLFALGAFWCLKKIKLPAIQRPLATVGRQALAILVFHLIVLKYVEYSKLEKTSNFWLILLWFGVLLAGGMLLPWVRQQIKIWVPWHLQVKDVAANPRQSVGRND